MKMLRKDNLITKFREFWSGLSNREQVDLWDIMTAMRSSDSSDSSDNLKTATTARIRGELLGVNCRRGFMYFNLQDVKANVYGCYSPVGLVKALKEQSGHFQSHTQDAILVLNKYRPKKSMRDLQKFLDKEDRG